MKRTCDVCGKPLGDGVFVRWLNGVVHHVVCPTTPLIASAEAAVRRAQAIERAQRIAA